MSSDQDIPITPLEKKKSKKKILSLAIIFAFGVVAMFITSISLPGLSNVTNTGVSASYSSGPYSDCFVYQVNVYGNQSVGQIAVWNDNNWNTVYSIEQNTVIEQITVQTTVNVSRLSGGGTYMDHIYVSVYIWDPANDFTYIAMPTEVQVSNVGTSYNYYYSNNSVGFTIDETGSWLLTVGAFMQVP